jgi:hypothetical protein
MNKNWCRPQPERHHSAQAFDDFDAVFDFSVKTPPDRLLQCLGIS